MSRALIVLTGHDTRQRAAQTCLTAPPMSRVEFKAPKRTLPQNDKFWACLTDIARQVPWHGVKLTADDWKLIFLDGLKREMRLVPNLAGNGFVNLGRSSSDLSKEEMADLLTLIIMFADEHGVTLHDGVAA